MRAHPPAQLLKLETTPDLVDRVYRAVLDAISEGSLAPGERITQEDMASKLAVSRQPVLQALRQYPRQIALAAGAFIGVQVSFYICIAFVVAYGSGASGLGLPKSLMLSAVLIGAAAMIPTTIGFAALSDRIGRRRLYMVGAVLSGCWAFALFPLLETRSLLWISVGIATAQIFGSIMYGPLAALLSEMFETRVRYSAATLG